MRYVFILNLLNGLTKIMVRIYTVSDKRPDFIELQYEGFQNYLQDKEFEYIVCNNGSTEDLRLEIEKICQKLSIKTLFVEGDYLNGAIATQVPLIYCIKNYILNDDKDDITVILDSDIFLFASLSFEKLLEGKDLAGIYQQREVLYNRFFKRNHFYIWNAIMILRNSKINFSEFDISMIQNITDVGGRTHFYVKKYNPPIKWISHTADIEEAESKIFDVDLVKSYVPKFGMQIIAESLIHYYRGSNWDEDPSEYHKNKTMFLNNFLSLAKTKYPLDKEILKALSSETSHSQKHFNGQRNNLKKDFKMMTKRLKVKWT